MDTERHNMVVVPGDEELWVHCTCGKPLLSFYPMSLNKDLNEAFQCWYLMHGKDYNNND